MDHDDANDAICARAAIHMFGHKHRQRIQRDPQYVRFSAGAVNPDRHEPGWLPGYNLVEVRVVGSGQDRQLTVDAHLRQWQSNPDLFRAVVTPADDEVFRQSIRFPGQPAPAATAASGEPAVASAAEVAVGPGQDRGADREAAMGDPSTRNLVYRFWNLNVSERRDIALQLGLITEEELQLPEPERYGRALIRASERGQLDELARAVAQKERK
jgi:hypothetical protein